MFGVNSVQMFIDFSGLSNSVVSSDMSSLTERRYQSGDSNRDAQFDQLDLVQVLQASKYLADVPAIWGDGDWNGDGVFDQLDIIEALPNYGTQPAAVTSSVPEPSTLGMAVMAACLVVLATPRAANSRRLRPVARVISSAGLWENR